MSLPVMDLAEFRRVLVGVSDPDRMKTDGSVAEHIKQEAVALCVVLADLFGSDLDRKTLWERIGSALAQAVAKVQDGDLDQFVSLCLGHVVADAGRSAAHDGLGRLLGVFGSWPIEVRQSFTRYVAQRPYAVLVYARQRWQQVLAEKKGGAE